jgi:hypothetical protein
MAGLGGLVFSILMVLFAMAGLFKPTESPGIYVPIFIVYGFLQGGALSWVIPRLGNRLQGRQLALKTLQASIFIGLMAIPAIYLVYQESSLARLPLDWFYALLMPAGLGLAVNHR